MEREPARQQHDLDRHDRNGAPRELVEQGQCDSRENVTRSRAAMREDRIVRTDHVRRFRGIADQFQRVISFDAGADVEIPAEE